MMYRSCHLSNLVCPKNIVCDFDGTLCDFAFPNIGPIKKGALQALALFKILGYTIIISSCRTCKYYPEIFGHADGVLGSESVGHKAMVKWLDDNRVPYDYIDDGTMGKPMADFYIDDKGIRFTDNWEDIANFVAERT